MRWVLQRSRCFKSSPFVELSNQFPHPFIAKSKQLNCCWYHASEESLVNAFHAKVVKDGSIRTLNVGNYVLSSYSDSKNFDYAQKLFDEMLDRDVRTWTILMSAFARMGSYPLAFDLFREMITEGFCPNHFTLSTVLKSCSRVSDIKMGKGIHGWILRSSVNLDVVLENSILDVYAKLKAIDYVEKFFESMREKNTVSYNIMLGACMLFGDVERSLSLFKSLPYRDTASWNTIIDGLVRGGNEKTALELLYQMVGNGVELNKVTFSIALGLVSSLLVKELGRQVHGRVMRFGIHSDGFVRTSLIDMYCKFGELEKASVIFRNMPLDFVRTKRSVFTSEETMTEIVSLSLMVSGYVRNGKPEDALEIFLSVVRDRVVVDKFTITSIVSACSSIGILELGRQIHGYIQKIGYSLDAHLGSSLIDMYAKCGSLDDARKIFKQITCPNVVLWTSMVSGCALHGQGREAIKLFENMTKEGITPNEVTFVGLLTACSHAGLVEEGCKYFSSMKRIYNINPTVEHYTCMVDLYGRAGRLNETKEFIQENGISHMCEVWRAFLSSCLIHKDADMGRWVSERLFQLEPRDAGPYVSLSNMCSTSRRWKEAAETRSLMKRRGVVKTPGQSWLQLKNQVHCFVVGDRSHPQDTFIYSYLNMLIGRLREIGYESDVNLVMQDVEEEQGEVIMGYHSEKLAVAFGIISSATSGAPIRIMKNLRICSDCHNFMKLTSKLLGREMIVRDIHRFHHFNSGHCSCGDYW